MCDTNKVMDKLLDDDGFAQAYPAGPLREMFVERFVGKFPTLLADKLDAQATRKTFLQARLSIWKLMAENDLWCDFVRATHAAGISVDEPLELMLRNTREGIADEVGAIELNLELLDIPAAVTVASKCASLMLYNETVRAGFDLENMTMREVLETFPIIVIV